MKEGCTVGFGFSSSRKNFPEKVALVKGREWRRTGAGFPEAAGSFPGTISREPLKFTANSAFHFYPVSSTGIVGVLEREEVACWWATKAPDTSRARSEARFQRCRDCSCTRWERERKPRLDIRRATLLPDHILLPSSLAGFPPSQPRFWRLCFPRTTPEFCRLHRAILWIGIDRGPRGSRLCNYQNGDSRFKNSNSVWPTTMQSILNWTDNSVH